MSRIRRFSNAGFKESSIQYTINSKSCRKVIAEAFTPLHDRVINLALPQRDRKGSKRMRLKIIIAILQLIIEDADSSSQAGIHLNIIKSKLDTLCSEWKEDQIGISN